MLKPPRRGKRAGFGCGGAAPLVIILLGVAGPVVAQTPGTMALHRQTTPALAGLPSDLVPLPGSPQYLRASQQRQVAGLLRGFEGIARAEVIIAGEGPALSACVVVRPRPGARVDGELAETMAQTVIRAVPGLTPRGIMLIDSSGRALYVDGRAQVAEVEPPTTTGTVVGLLGGAVAVGVLGAWALLRTSRRRRGPRPEADGLGTLIGLSDQDLDRVLQGERSGLLDRMVAESPPAVGRRLRRYARSRGQSLSTPQRPPEPEVWQAVVDTVRLKVRQHGPPAGR